MRLTEAPILPPLPAREYAQLRDSIRDRGVLQPLLITADHVLIDGHERWRAIQELGLTRYPLRVLGNLSEAERKELAIHRKTCFFRKFALRSIERLLVPFVQPFRNGPGRRVFRCPERPAGMHEKEFDFPLAPATKKQARAAFHVSSSRTRKLFMRSLGTRQAARQFSRWFFREVLAARRLLDAMRLFPRS